MIGAGKSLIQGVLLQVVASEVSGATTLYHINRERLVGNRPAARGCQQRIRRDVR